MKKVLLYTDTPNIGGAEKHMLLLAKYLKKKGHKVSLAFGKYSKLMQTQKEFEPFCEQIYQIKTLHKHDPRHFFALKKLLREGQFDLLHLHLWNPGSCRYAFFAATATGTPIITTEHDPFELHGIKKWIKKACLKRTSQTITVSSDNFRLLDDYYEVPKERLKLVPNGIEIDRFLDNHDKADLPVQKGDQVITCIAELHLRKGHRYLLEAFRKLQAEMPHLRLILVGRGPAEAQLKTQAQDIPNVHFLGWRDDIPQILRTSDIFILPSLREAFGLTVLEAMASGTIAVATNNGGTVDIIQDGVTGYLIPPSSAQAIYERLSIILKNPQQKADIEREAQHRLREKFTAEKMAEATLAVYQEVC